MYDLSPNRALIEIPLTRKHITPTTKDRNSIDRLLEAADSSTNELVVVKEKPSSKNPNLNILLNWNRAEKNGFESQFEWKNDEQDD